MLKELRPNEVLATKLKSKEKFDEIPYLIDDLFILLTIKTSLKWDPAHPINIHKFTNSNVYNFNVIRFYENRK